MEEKKLKLLDVSGLHVRYGSFEAVKGVSFSLCEGEILGIVGESGSGKSTIAKTLIGLERASEGKVEYFFGHESDTTAIPESIQMIFQDAVGSLNPRMTVRQTLEADGFDKAHHGERFTLIECGVDSTAALQTLANSLNTSSDRNCTAVEGGTNLVYIAPPPSGLVIIFK